MKCSQIRVAASQTETDSHKQDIFAGIIKWGEKHQMTKTVFIVPSMTKRINMSGAF